MGVRHFVFYRTHRGTIPDNEMGDCPAFDDLSAALDQRPAIAVIANPTARHLEVALTAAEAGCDLFIEKPLSGSLDGCDELLDSVRKRRLVAAVGCQFRFHPLLIRLRNEVLAGRCGAVFAARAEWGEYLPDWHPWEDHRHGYSARPELGGGVILTLIHPLDYLYWLFGPAQRVQAMTRSIATLQTAAHEDWAEIALEFESNIVAQVHLDYWQRPPVHRLSVWGDKGRADLDFHAGVLTWTVTGERDVVPESAPAEFDRNSMFVDEMRCFLSSVKSRQRTAVPLEEGIDVLKMALDAKDSARGERANA